jgi:hypothetical protein
LVEARGGERNPTAPTLDLIESNTLMKNPPTLSFREVSRLRDDEESRKCLSFRPRFLAEFILSGDESRFLASLGMTISGKVLHQSSKTINLESSETAMKGWFEI